MFAYEPPVNPPCDIWEEYQKPALIMDWIHKICKEIVRDGDDSRFPDAFDMLYRHIENNIEEFMPEVTND